MTKIGLGLAAIGRPEYINLRKTNDSNKSEAIYKKRAMDLLDYAYDKGLRNFDTAPSYGKGEDYLIEWYKQHNYQDLNISTKWGYTYVANWEIGYSGAHEIKEHSLEKLQEQWPKSKQLLPALGIYQIHSATFDSGVLTNQEVLNELFRIKKETGIKIGLSVSGPEQNSIVKTAAEKKVEGQLLFDSFQVTYNILESTTHQTLKKILEQGKTVIVKEALANGRLFRHKDYPHYGNLYHALESMAKYHKVGVDAIALRYIMDYLGPTLVLSGVSNSTQLDENLKVNDFKLNRKEIQTLSEFSVDGQSYWNERKQLVWN